MTIKTKDQLYADFPDDALRDQPNAITATKIRDLIDSLGVGGILYGSGTQAISTSVQAFTAYTDSNRSKGVSADDAAGTLTLQAGADGFYQVMFVVTMTIPGNGQVQLRLRKNGTNTPFKSGAIDIIANEQKQIVVAGSGDLIAGDVIDVSIQGSGTATATVDSCQFQIDR